MSPTGSNNHHSSPARKTAKVAGRSLSPRAARTSGDTTPDGKKKGRSASKGVATSRKEPDQDTRKRVIEAAIKCILEQGFYRASSNAIAERAGLTWGVIQYYFGSRESLMLAVLEEGTRRLVDDLSTAEITGETLTARIEEYIAIVERYYADPEYLAFIQVLLNLSHDPRTSAQTVETMKKISRTVEAELKRLAGALLSGTTARQRELRGLVFHVLRGLALSEVMLGSLPYDTQRQGRDFPIQRQLLAEALALLIEREGGGRTPPKRQVPTQRGPRVGASSTRQPN